MRDNVKTAIREAVRVPEHIRIAASACASDLLQGPAYARVPEEGDWTKLTEDDISPIRSDLEGEITQVYTGPVGDMLREFISDLPTVYVDEDDFAHLSEPEGVEDEESGEVFEPTPYREMSNGDVVEALFGPTIAKEFR